MNLVILEPGEVSDSGDVALSGGRAEHLVKVLKVAPGHRVRVGILDGPLGLATVHSVSRETIGLHCSFDGGCPARPRVDLLLALPRPKVMRRLWAQLSALGVGRILLTNAERVERNYFDTHVLNPECYRPLLIEGLQQAQDTRLPLVTIHRQFKVLVEDDLVGLPSTRIVADPAAITTPVEAIPGNPAERILLAVGPEGGWNSFELRLLASHDFQPVGMGRRTLRTDTACIALLSLINAMERHGPE